MALVLPFAFALAGCGDDDVRTDGGTDALVTDSGADASSDALTADGGAPDAEATDAGSSTDGRVALSAPGLDVEGQIVFAHWSQLGGQTGTMLPIGAWPDAALEFEFSPADLASVPEERADLSLDGFGVGTVSIAWLEVGTADSIVASAADAVLIELSEDATSESWFGRLLGGPVAAGVHLLRVRPFTTAEVSALEACAASASNPDLECPALKEHVELAPSGTNMVELMAGDVVPDLS